jgi:hypothetical protein
MSLQNLPPDKGLVHFYVPCKGGNDEVGGRWRKTGARAALVPAFARPTKVGQRPSDAHLNTRSLHSTDHRFAMICSGRDDRVGES